MTILLGLLAGLVLALVVVHIARAKPPREAMRLYAAALVVAAVIYVGFALVGGASGTWLGAEALGVVLFVVPAVIGARRWPALLALGWAAHVAWDAVHMRGAGAAYTPDWYPWLCVSFDLILAGGVLTHRREHDAAPLPARPG